MTDLLISHLHAALSEHHFPVLKDVWPDLHRCANKHPLHQDTATTGRFGLINDCRQKSESKLEIIIGQMNPGVAQMNQTDWLDPIIDAGLHVRFEKQPPSLLFRAQHYQNVRDRLRKCQAATMQLRIKMQFDAKVAGEEDHLLSCSRMSAFQQVKHHFVFILQSSNVGQWPCSKEK